jgi:hypothetical protein
MLCIYVSQSVRGLILIDKPFDKFLTFDVEGSIKRRGESMLVSEIEPASSLVVDVSGTGVRMQAQSADHNHTTFHSTSRTCFVSTVIMGNRTDTSSGQYDTALC